MPESRTADKMVIRLPNGLRPWIAAEAKKNLRSANSQAVLMLQAARDQIKKLEAVAGESLQAEPATVPNRVALQGGPITHGL